MKQSDSGMSRPEFLRSGALGAMAGGAAALLPGVQAAAATGAGRPAGRILLKGGYVVTLDPAVPDLKSGDVLIENGKIVAIQPAIAAADAQVIDASRSIVMPGFIDTHRHLWESLFRNYFPDLTYDNYFKFMTYGVAPSYRPQDAYAGNLIGALGALNAGITTICDFSQIQNTPEHSDAVIRALADSGMRTVFGYSFGSLGPNFWVDPGTSKYPEDIFRIQKQYFASDDQLLTLSLAAAGPGTCPREVVMRQWDVAHQAGVRIIVHAGSATKRGFYEPYANTPDFFRPTTTYIHCCAFSELEWKLVADSGGSVSFSPGSEMPMGHGMPATQKALDHGIRPSLSVDVETTEPGDFFTTIRLTLYLQRMELNLRMLAGEKNVPKWLTARDILELATIQGARALGLDHKTGTLTPGKDADIIMLRTDRIDMLPMNDAVGAVVQGMDTSNIDTVLVRGKVMKRNGQLVGVDVDRIRRLGESSRDYVVAHAQDRLRSVGGA